jgi:hypothetical protein
MKSWLMKNILYFYSTSFFFVCIIQCMDGPYFSYFDTWKIILCAGAKYIDRNSVRVFSESSKDCNALIRTTMQFREGFEDHRGLVLRDPEEKKHYFMQLYPPLELVPDIIWNQYGTVCARVSYGSKLPFILYEGERKDLSCSSIKEVLIERRFLLEPCFSSEYKVWNSVYNILPHEPKAYFEGISDLCFHVYGLFHVQDISQVRAQLRDISEVHVLEYRFASNTDTGLGTFICVTKIGKENIYLKYFLEFPLLLKAFLKSLVTEYVVDKPYKIFMLEGVTIPDNYHIWQKYHRYNSECRSFEQLPKKIRKAIIARYIAQHPIKKKKKKKWILF